MRTCLAFVLAPLLVALLLASPTAQPQRTEVQGTVPSYRDAPVFYDYGWEFYGEKVNLELMHEGKVKLGIIGIEPLDDFHWGREGKDATYWVHMENFWYLLPLIDSDKLRDREFVREWIIGWLDHYDANLPSNWGARDAMTVGFRAMTFVWYLKKLDQRGESEQEKELGERVKESLLWHQDYLVKTYRPVSNHGFWESMGLFETTRVHPDPGLAQLALERLMEMVSISVSAGGFHLEHSPAYHRFVWNWLDHFARYLSGLEQQRWSGLPILVDAAHRMRESMYYLYDHGRNMPQIGDTDSTVLADDQIPAEQREQQQTAVRYDEQAGFAVLKDPVESPSKRYVVFCIQSAGYPIRMPYHYHSDVLSVYFSYDGEIILGDGGRYSYTGGSWRNYYLSNAAHNTIMPTRRLGDKSVTARATSVLWQNDNDIDVFTASHYGGNITRVVELPRDRPVVRVIDTIVGSGDVTILWNMGYDVADVSSLPNDWTPDSLSRTYRLELATAQGRRVDVAVRIDAEPPQHANEVSIVGAQKNPYLGWLSPSQHVARPAKVIRTDIAVQDQATVSTTFTFIDD